LDDLLVLLSPFKIKCVCCDDNFAYQSHVKGSVVLSGKRNTQRIERKHLLLRTWCSRLVRRGIRFSKSEVMHHTVIGLVINVWFFKRKLLFNLL
jgi:insertion element IS1 protein InsB